MPRVRVVRAWWGSIALIAGVWGCETARNPGGVQRDLIPPTITLSTTADTQQIASGLAFTRIGLKAGPLSQWLHAGLTAVGLPATLIETRHVKAALKAMTVKTDRKDARGIAQLLRMGWYRPVHGKSVDSQEVRALLVGRKLLQAKLQQFTGGECANFLRHCGYSHSDRQGFRS